MRRVLAPPALLLLLACGPGPTALPEVPLAPASPLPPPAALVPSYAPAGLALDADVSYARTAEGGVLGWGDAWGVRLPAPVDLNGQPLAGVVELAAAGGTTCARLVAGEVRCWRGRWRDPRASWSAVVPGLRADAIRGSGNQHCARHGGAVACWLSNKADDAEAIRAISGVHDAVDLAVGTFFGCALVADGSILCWGADDRGQSGPVSPPDSVPRAQRHLTARPVPGISRARAVAAGAAHACAILEQGSVACWGARQAGQLTGEVGLPAPTPQRVPDVSRAKALALGEHHACALLEDGQVTCWGANYRGQAAPGRRSFAVEPTRVPGLAGVTEIAAGPEHTCARRGEGTIACWGDDRRGQLGVGDTALRRGLVEVGRRLPAPAKPADPACPRGRVHVEDWDRWAAQLGAGDEAARAEELARVGLPPFPADDAEGLERACLHQPSVLHVGSQEVQLTDDGPPLRLVEVRYRVCAPEPDPLWASFVDGTMRAVAHQLLRPLGGGDYCPVPGGPESFGRFEAHGCERMHPHDEEPGQVGVVELVSAKHKTLEVQRSTGSCLMTGAGMEQSYTTFFEVRGPAGAPALVGVFSSGTHSASRDRWLALPTFDARIVLGQGAFPRIITVENETICDGVYGQGANDCSPGKWRETFVYRGGEYVDPKKPPPRARRR